MKTKLLFIAILGLLTSPVFSQVEGNQRGLYVNQFVDLWHNSHPLHTNNTINTNSSILGNVTAENELLKYCMENHITYLVLYDLSKVFEGMNSTTLATKLDDLKIFICKAKRDYCIKYVGASVTVNSYSNIQTGLGLKQTPPYIFDSIFHGTALYDSLNYLEDTIATDDTRFKIAEILKLSLRLAFMNGSDRSVLWTKCKEENVDILLTEYEFWRTGTSNAFNGPGSTDYVGLIDALDVIRNTHNNMTGNSKMYIETYLGRLAASIPSGITDCDIAEYIDGLDIDGKRRVDRIHSDYYTNDPNGVYNSTPNFYGTRFLNFCESPAGSCAGGLSTQENTDYHPIFSAQSPNVGASVNSNFLGSWFPVASDRNIFTAERTFFDDYSGDIYVNVHPLTNESNDVQPGACQWLGQAYMVKPLNHPITFQSYQSPCPGSGNQNVTLIYQGPIENKDAYYAGTAYRYVLENSVGQLFTPTGNASGTVAYTAGTTGVNSVVYSLPPDPGNYKASLTLTYGTGCFYTYQEDIVVSEQFNIHALNNPGNLLGPINLCANDHVILQANWWVPGTSTGNVYTWSLNGNVISGANSYEYSATQSGDYVCTISTSTCSTQVSNVIHVTTNLSTPRFIVATCGGSGCATVCGGNCVTLEVQPQFTSTDTYSWQDGSTGATFPNLGSFPVAICNDNYPTYTVTVSDGVCSQTIWKDVDMDLINGTSVTASTLTSSPDPANVCPGTSVHLSTNASTSTSFLWSTGQSSTTDDPLDNIYVTNPGNYFVITHNAVGCEAISDPIEVINHTPEIVLTASGTSVCEAGDPIVLTATGGTSTTVYTWSTGLTGQGSTFSTTTVNPTNTGTYSVTATDGNGCVNTSSVTISVPLTPGCFTIRQAAVPTVTYAGYPVKFTIEVCNNSPTAQIFHITDAKPQNFVISSSTPNPLAATITDVPMDPGPSCKTFVIEGYFTQVNNFCSPIVLSHTNKVYMKVGTDATTIYDGGEECVRVLATCPLITYANGDCAEESIVDVCLGVHKLINSVQSVDLSLVYPAFLEPPIAGPLTSSDFSSLSGTLGSGSNIDVPMTSASIGGVSYMEVRINVVFSPLVNITANGPNEFFCLKFKNKGAPAGMNQFKLSDSDLNTDINYPTAPSGGSQFQFYTQASSVYLHNCTDIPNTFDASFRITRTGCSKPGEITVTADEDSANVIHTWDFGDVRRTPQRGSPVSFTWDYFADYTDNTSATQSRVNGNYTFTITHTITRGNTSYVDTQIVAITGKLDGSVTPTDNVCLSPNFGTATVSPIYGTAPYTYSWSTGANTATVNGLTAGNHTVTITDDSLCTKVINITVATPDSSSGPSCVTVTPVNTSCITATKLTWTAASSCLKGYDLTVWSGSGTPSYLVYHEDVGTDTSYSLSPLNPSTTYYYKVVPFDLRDSLTQGCSTGSFTSGASQAVSPTLSTTITLGAESASVPALPCGMLVENYDQHGASSWYTSTTAPRTGSNHMRIDKNPDNTTDLNDWFFSPPINVTKGHVYRVSWYDRIASGTSAETYKVYLGTSADASTLLGDGPLFNGISSSTTYHKDSTIDYLATSSGQIYFGFWATSLANQGSIYIDDIQIKEIQVTRVDTTYCNTTLSSANLIYAYSVSGVSNYKYKFVGTGGQSGYNFEHGTSNSNTSFYPITQAPGVIYGYTYNVSVSYKKNNIWSPYGASCPVTLSAFPQNKLVDNPSTPGLCDYIVTDQHELINVVPIAGASKYQYKIVENDTTNSYVYDTTSTTFNSVDELRLDMASITPKVRYGYYYNVKVRALVGSTNSTYGSRPGEWGTFGPTCVVNVSGLPTTSLTSTYCNTNQTTLNDIFYVTPISSASQYRYHITASGYDNTIETSNSNSFFRFTSINPAVSPGGVKYGTTYSIEAAAAVGGAWLPYGSTCTLTTPTAPLTKLQTSQCNTSISSGSTFLYWDAIYGASNYLYKVSGTFSNGYRTREIYRNSSNNFFILSWANQTGSTILANQTYYVQVKYYAGQWEAYGDSCSITTNSNYSRYIDSLEAESPNLSMLSMNVYPNPNPYHSEFSVELNGIKEKNQKVDLFIFNSEGASVYRAAIVSKEENRIVIKPQIDLAPGVYIVLSDVNGVRLQKKFVVE